MVIESSRRCLPPEPHRAPTSSPSDLQRHLGPGLSEALPSAPPPPLSSPLFFSAHLPPPLPGAPLLSLLHRRLSLLERKTACMVLIKPRASWGIGQSEKGREGGRRGGLEPSYYCYTGSPRQKYFILPNPIDKNTSSSTESVPLEAGMPITVVCAGLTPEFRL